MAKDSGPVLQHRRIGMQLRSLRENSGLTIEQAGEAIGRSDSTISRIENGRRRVQKLEMKGLLDAYGVAEEDRAVMLQFLQEAPEQAWWTSFDDALPPGLETYIGLEADAATLRVVAPLMVHSLLMIEDYARAIIRAGKPTAPDKEINRLVALRMQRQQVLARQPTPLDLLVVLDEAALRRQVGSAAVMRDQIKHLITSVETVPNIAVQVLTFDKGAHAAQNGGYMILDFPDPADPVIVYVDSPGGNLYIQKPQDTRAFTTAFGRLCGAALSPDESVQFLRTALKET